MVYMVRSCTYVRPFLVRLLAAETRERANNNCPRQRCLNRSYTQGAPTPADDHVRRRVLLSCILNPCADCDGHDREGSDCKGGGRWEADEELRVVERLVAGLLEDNLRLESVVRQLQVRVCELLCVRFFDMA